MSCPRAWTGAAGTSIFGPSVVSLWSTWPARSLRGGLQKNPWTMAFHHLQKLPHPTDPPKNQQIDKILVSEWSLWGPLFFLGFCSWISWAAHLLKILWHTAFHHMDPAKALAIRVSANILITANLHQISNPVLESQGSGLRQLTWHRPWDHSFSRICWLLFQQKV